MLATGLIFSGAVFGGFCFVSNGGVSQTRKENMERQVGEANEDVFEG